ncbi:unnamed protein product [Hermetia illucens]|uniref:Glycine-rich protein n=1 Tax=Hermetia illucens TaxID=343691 RepID=A0A7R8UUB7_HERIL|nr:unnamed protein product [Hermetia illucens]
MNKWIIFTFIIATFAIISMDASPFGLGPDGLFSAGFENKDAALTQGSHGPAGHHGNGTWSRPPRPPTTPSSG